MPLEHSASEEAFKHNVETEMEAGKPQKQAVAVAYSEKRRAAHDAAEKLCSGVEALCARMDDRFTGGLWGQEGGRPTRTKVDGVEIGTKGEMHGTASGDNNSAGMDPAKK